MRIQSKGPKPRELHSQGGSVPLPGHLDADVPHTKVELMLFARNLKDKDVFSKSDPMCVVYLLKDRGDLDPEFVEIGRTEVIYNNLDPKWNTKIQLDYFFETKQQLRFDIYDIDAENTKDLSQHDFLGRCQCHLADIVAAVHGALKLDLVDEPSQRGQLIVRAEEVDDGQKEIVHMVCHGKQVASKGICWCCFSKDPFLEFHRLYPDGTKQLVHRTEVKSKTVDPEWRPIEITLRHLSEGDKNREFLIECYDYNMTGRHKLLGTIRVSVNKLIAQRQQNFKFLRYKRGSKKVQKIGGALQFLHVDSRREYTWLDYVKGGMQLEFMVAIDFTASNGDVRLPSSRHYIDPLCLNQYEIAIRSVLEVCEHYNNTKEFEAFGFGAKEAQNENVSHIFPLAKQPNVYGIKGVMDAYRTTLNNVRLYGPTYFEPTVRYAFQKCQTFPRDGSRYQILLIITDGLIDDMTKTKLAIIQASDQPLSIIIIGVGGEDFTKMNELDSDDSMLKDGPLVAKRDIVQFVPFQNYYGAVQSQNSKLTPQQQSHVQMQLAKAVLEEIPYQVTSFMKMNRIEPMHEVGPTASNVSISQPVSNIYPPSAPPANQ